MLGVYYNCEIVCMLVEVLLLKVFVDCGMMGYWVVVVDDVMVLGFCR